MSHSKDRFDIILPIVLLSYFMIVLDSSIVFTSTVKIAADLHLNSSLLSWISNAYVLTFGSFLLLGGRAGDIFGRKKIFVAGLLIFSVSSFFVGISTNATTIITGRTIQGLGASILAPTSLALLMDNYKGSLRTRAIAYYGAVAGLGSSFGLVIGGIIASYFSWRWGFLLNVPIGIILSIMSLIYIKDAPRERTPLDILGNITSILGFISLVYGINGPVGRTAALIFAVIMLAIFVMIERHSKYPTMPLRLFADVERSSAYITRFFYMGAMLSFFFIIPQALQDVYGFTPLSAAWAFLPETVPQFIVAILVARISMRFSNTQILMTGIIVTFLGTGLGAVIGIQHGYILAFALPMLLVGIGQGLSLSTLTISGIANTSADIAGSASGVVNTFHQIGSSFGLSVVTALTAQFKTPLQEFNHAFDIIGLLMLFSLLASMGILYASRRRSELTK